MPKLRQGWIDPMRDLQIIPEEMGDAYNRPLLLPRDPSQPPTSCKYFLLIDNIDPGQYEDSEDQNDAVEEKKK